MGFYRCSRQEGVKTQPVVVKKLLRPPRRNALAVPDYLHVSDQEHAAVHLGDARQRALVYVIVDYFTGYSG
jgi:hypothetical protein